MKTAFSICQRGACTEKIKKKWEGTSNYRFYSPCRIHPTLAWRNFGGLMIVYFEVLLLSIRKFTPIKHLN